MYSECPHCRAIFAVTTIELDARQGLVRCGCCHRIFNASWNLVDSLPTGVGATLPSENHSLVAAGEGSADADTGLATRTDLDIAGDRASEALVALDVREPTADLGLQDAKPEDGAHAETPAESLQQDAPSTDLDATLDADTASASHPSATPTETEVTEDESILRPSTELDRTVAPETDTTWPDEVEDRFESTETAMHSLGADTRVVGDTETIEPIPIEEAATVIAQELRKSADVEFELEDDPTPAENADTLEPASDKFATETSVRDQVTDRALELPHHVEHPEEEPDADNSASADSTEDPAGAGSDTPASNIAVLEPPDTELLDDDAQDTPAEPDDEVDETAQIVASGDESAEAGPPQQASELTQDTAANDWEEVAEALAPTDPSHAEDLEDTADQDETQTESARPTEQTSKSAAPEDIGKEDETDVDVHIEDDGDDLDVVGLDTGSESQQDEPEVEPALAYADDEAQNAAEDQPALAYADDGAQKAAEDQPALTLPRGVAEDSPEDQLALTHPDGAAKEAREDQPTLATPNDTAGQAIDTATLDSKLQEIGTRIDPDAASVDPEGSKEADQGKSSAPLAANNSTAQAVTDESEGLEAAPLHDDDAESIPEVNLLPAETASQAPAEEEVNLQPTELAPEELVELEAKPAHHETGSEALVERDTKPEDLPEDLKEEEVKLPPTEPAPEELADLSLLPTETASQALVEEEADLLPTETASQAPAEEEADLLPTETASQALVEEEADLLPAATASQAPAEEEVNLLAAESVPQEPAAQDTNLPLTELGPQEVAEQDVKTLPAATHTTEFEEPVTPVLASAEELAEAEPPPPIAHQDTPAELKTERTPGAEQEDTPAELETETAPLFEQQDAMVESQQDSPSLAGDEPEVDETTIPSSEDASIQDVAAQQMELESSAAETTDTHAEFALRTLATETTDTLAEPGLGTSTTETTDTHSVPDLESSALETADTDAVPDLEGSATEITDTHAEPDIKSSVTKTADADAVPDLESSATPTTNTHPVPDEEIVLESFEYDWSALEDSLSPAAKDKTSADALGIAPYVHSEARLVRNSAGRSAATPLTGKGTSAKAPRPRPTTARTGAETPVSAPYRATPSAEVLAGSRRGKLALWTLGSTLLLALLVGQFGYFYWDELAQNPATRTYLIRMCEVMKCEVRARRAPGLIDLAHTSVSSHPAVPGALRITANLVNRAEYAQPYPTLQVSLTNVEGRVIGRRSFQPTQYLSADVPSVAELFPNAATPVALDLTRPDDRAIGYEVELVSP